VAGHIASAQAAVMCAELGMDTIEHGYALDRHALQVMKDHGVIYVPPLWLQMILAIGVRLVCQIGL